jgi:NAD(P)-dependent dehydrogenase (short-subunit alcohol dehydrogenase family)
MRNAQTMGFIGSSSESGLTLKPLAGKTALVTGAAKRIGRGIALKLAAAGANVAITYRESQPEAEATVRALAEFNVDGLAVRTDLRDAASIDETVAAVVEEFGRLDILVNNAGVFESVALEKITVEQWDRMFATNTRAPFLMAQAAYPHLRAAGGGSSTSARWAVRTRGRRTRTTAPRRRRCTCSRRPWPRRGRRRSA